MSTLEPLIIEHIRPGSMIMSDKLGAHNDIERLVDGNGDSMNYVHHSVNHKEEFVNFDNPWVHTETIERQWGDMKEVIKRRGVSKKVSNTVRHYICISKNHCF